jgi:hypothetical protein
MAPYRNLPAPQSISLNFHIVKTKHQKCTFYFRNLEYTFIIRSILENTLSKKSNYTNFIDSQTLIAMRYTPSYITKNTKNLPQFHFI